MCIYNRKSYQRLLESNHSLCRNQNQIVLYAFTMYNPDAEKVSIGKTMTSSFQFRSADSKKSAYP